MASVKVNRGVVIRICMKSVQAVRCNQHPWPDLGLVRHGRLLLANRICKSSCGNFMSDAALKKADAVGPHGRR